MKALTITRISSEDQKYGYGPDSQWEDDVIENAPKLGLEVCEELRRNIEERATDWDRGKYTEVINEAIELHNRGVIQAVVFPRIDRETRFVFSSVPLLSKMLKSGLQIYFARELLHLDPKDPEAVGIYLNKVGQSHAYVETMRINTMRGRRNRAKKDGLLPTGGVNLYGYIYDKNTGKRSINHYEKTIIRKMVDWVLNEGIALNEVCRRLMDNKIPAPKGGKIWSRATVGRMLNNQVYTGKTYSLRMEAVEPRRHKIPGAYSKCGRRLRPKEEWVLLPEDTTPQIVTETEFEAIQRQLARNRELSPRNQKHHYLLRGFVYCQQCGRKFYGIPDNGRRYYRCSGRSSVSAYGNVCHNRRLNADDIEEKVWHEVVWAISKPDRLVRLYNADNAKTYDQGLTQNLQGLKEKLAILENGKSKLYRLFEFTPMTEVEFQLEWSRNEAQHREIEHQITQIEQRLARAREKRYTEARIREIATTLKEILHTPHITFEFKRQIFEALKMKAWVSRDFHAVELAIAPIPTADIVSTHL